MAVRWAGLNAPELTAPEGTLVLLGASDAKKGFRVIGAVFSHSQESLVKDIISDGGIFFEGGGTYDPFDNPEANTL